MDDTLCMNNTTAIRKPTLVTATEWGVSTLTGSEIDGVILNVHRVDHDAPNQWGGLGVCFKHPVHDGLTFPTKADADAYAVGAGLLREFVR